MQSSNNQNGSTFSVASTTQQGEGGRRKKKNTTATKNSYMKLYKKKKKTLFFNSKLDCSKKKTMSNKTKGKPIRTKHVLSAYNLLFFSCPIVSVKPCLHSCFLSKCQALLTTMNVVLQSLRDACTVPMNTSLRLHFLLKN